MMVPGHLMGVSLVALSVATQPAWAQQAPQAAAQTGADARDNGAGDPRRDDAGASPQQETGNAPAPDDIVVTGVRASLRSAVGIKRNAGAIVDSIVAQDIGKLPDNNVAEALQRVTGVQVTRSQGQGRGIAIRGLSQVQTLLDGREIFSAASRSLTVSDVPAELVGGIDVYKTAQADQIEGGLGGTVDLRTRRPFDFKGLEIGASVKGEYTDLLGKVKPYASALVSNRWSTGIGDIGALLSASYQNFAYRIDRNAVGTFSERRDLYDRDGDGVFPNDPDDLIVSPTDVGQRYTYGNRKQLGINGSLQWAPSDSLEFHLDGLYTRYRSDEENQLIYALTGTSGIRTSPAVAVPPFEFAEDGLTIQRGRWNNAGLTTSTYTQDDTTDTYQFALGGKYERDGVQVTGDVSYSRSISWNTYNEFVIRGQAATYDLDLSQTLPVIAVTGLDPTKIAGFTLNRLTFFRTRTTGDQFAARLDSRFEIADRGMTAFKLGFRYAKRKAGSERIEDNYTYPTGADAIDAGPFLDTQRLTDNDLFSGRDIAIRQWLTARSDLLRDYVGLRERIGYRTTALPSLIPTNAYDFDEETVAGYVKADFAWSLFSIPMDGNLGMRVIATTTTGNSAVTLPGGGYAPLTQSNRYVDALPSVNVRAKLRDNLFLRLAASKSLTRPGFSQLNPALRLDYLFLSGSAGNPSLRPLRADQYDASLEWYMPGGGLAYAAGFIKNVDGFIQNSNENEVHEGLTFLISRPRNGDNGKIKGFELGYQQFFDFLPAPFDGLGVQANYTYVDSKAPSSVVGQTVPLENLSKNSYNLVGIYEKYGVSLRVAYNWRSAFVNTTGGGGAGNLPIYSNAQPQLDASLNYDVTPNVTLTLEGQNLTRPDRIDYYGYMYRPKAVLIQDRRIQVGVRFRL
ncbi:TonB-dependent receptor [Sphingomonas cannabina]|uniref:TonB-dependent receptor n=1 Tax=Sphingomonas cannabina TaxID=2899123 RepID=UPI001F491578|nr:TonB-dependent receptor [Sphingomonas cannabina]UIJ47304.1 TonB-dependent receptor [Sphingomonas cannabina]